MLLPGINTVGEMIPLRKNSKLISRKRPRETTEAFVPVRQSLDSAHDVQPRSSPGRTPVKEEVCNSPVPESSRAPRGIITVSRREAEVLCDVCKDKIDNIPDHSNVDRPDTSHGHDTNIKPEITDSSLDTNVPKSGAILLHRASDGRLTLSSRTLVPAPDQPPSTVKSDVKAEQPKSEQPKPSEDDAALDDLDEYTKAAIIALRNRSASKKQEASLRRKNLLVNKKPAAAVSPKPEPKTEHKSAAAPSAAASTQPKSGPLCKVARKTSFDPDIIPRAKIFGAMPKSKPSDGSNPAPIHYNGGVIYTSWSSRKFRALTTRGDVYTEKSKGWTSNSRKPCIDAWKFCVAAIDAARKK